MTHVPHRKAVTFCVNIRHSENLERLFAQKGIEARSISGQMSRSIRNEVLSDFRAGKIKVLCACDILNEGWDCPEIEVLLMARPTLSKVIYLQQLGRGTRKAPGKKSLIVIDFVDNATRYNAPQSLHRITGKGKYRPGELVMAPSEMLQVEGADGERPDSILEIGIWVRDYEEIDIFNWQEKRKDLISVSELEVELATSEGYIKRSIDKGITKPDYTLPLGDKTYYYFEKARVESIRIELDLPKVSASSIKGLFLEYVAEMDLSSSYKPVLLLSLLDTADETGRAKIVEVVNCFQLFYKKREKAKQIVEKSNIRMSRINELDELDIQRVILGMPFEKFERRKYLKYDKDLAYIRFEPKLWKQLTVEDKENIQNRCHSSLNKYYESIKK